MPFTLPGKRNTIGKQIEEHLLKGKNTSSVIKSSSANTISVVAAENIPLGIAVALNVAGQLIEADTSPAIGVSASAGTAGSSVVVAISSEILIPDVTFEINKEVWLINDSPNMTTDLPDIDTVPFLQSLGTALTENKLLIKIKPPNYIE